MIFIRPAGVFDSGYGILRRTGCGHAVLHCGRATEMAGSIVWVGLPSSVVDAKPLRNELVTTIQ